MPSALVCLSSLTLLDIMEMLTDLSIPLKGAAEKPLSTVSIERDRFDDTS